jgi:hypothetical protein
MNNVKLFFWKQKDSFSLEIAALLFAVALMLRGCRCHQVYAQSCGALKILKMKYSFSHLAPGEAVPCRLRNPELSGKRTSATREPTCFLVQALRFKRKIS